MICFIDSNRYVWYGPLRLVRVFLSTRLSSFIRVIVGDEEQQRIDVERIHCADTAVRLQPSLVNNDHNQLQVSRQC
jgi:hypothetical protein